MQTYLLLILTNAIFAPNVVIYGESHELCEPVRQKLAEWQSQNPHNIIVASEGFSENGNTRLYDEIEVPSLEDPEFDAFANLLHDEMRFLEDANPLASAIIDEIEEKQFSFYMNLFLKYDMTAIFEKQKKAMESFKEIQKQSRNGQRRMKIRKFLLSWAGNKIIHMMKGHRGYDDFTGPFQVFLKVLRGAKSPREFEDLLNNSDHLQLVNTKIRSMNEAYKIHDLCNEYPKKTVIGILGAKHANVIKPMLQKIDASMNVTVVMRNEENICSESLEKDFQDIIDAIKSDKQSQRRYCIWCARRNKEITTLHSKRKHS